jgi:hypothetical protein
VGEPVALVCGGEEVEGFVSGERHAATSCPAGLGAQPEMMVKSVGEGMLLWTGARWFSELGALGGGMAGR